MTRLSCLAAGLALAALPLAARAEHARIDLQLIQIDPATGADGDSVAANSDTDPPPSGFNERPVAKVKADEPLVLQFVYTNTYPHGIIKDAGVRYFVVREDKVGQKERPQMKDPVTEGRIVQNFKPACRIGVRVNFKIHEPGVYLLRIEGFNTASDHEHFSAIDIQVDKAP